MDKDIPIPQEVLDAEAPCDCGYPMSAHQRPDWFCCDWRKKHDELVELVREYLELLSVKEYFWNLDLPDFPWSEDCWDIAIDSLHDGLDCYEAAIRKAVEEKR
jgi:hypothetical protein